MATRNLFIRLIADCIYFLRYRTIRSGNARFIVFTGTSGKTLARSATAYALRKAGYRVIFPPYGYTNELGIVLAALGIESVRLFSFAGLARALTGRPPKGAYICVEAGADWYPDIPWFVRRFTPYGICITDVATAEWARPLAAIWDEKKELIRHISPDGFVCFSTRNPSLPELRSMKVPQEQRKEFTAEDNEFSSPLAAYMPYREAFGCAIACLECIDTKASLPKDFFSAYRGVPERFSLSVLRSGATVIADTYKAIPQCTEYVLDLARSLPAKKRIVVISEMRPLWRNERLHYEHLASLLQSFDATYFIGPQNLGLFLAELLPNLRVINGESQYPQIAKDILAEAGPGTTIVVKGAGRYRLLELVSLLER